MIYKVNVMRPAYATVLVQAKNEQEALNKAPDRAHETVGIDDYVFGDFKQIDVDEE